MAITIDYPSQVISIPRADLQLVQSSPTEIRQLDLDTFRLELRDLEDDEEGSVYPATVDHTQPKSISGVTLARVVEIINNYTITFEDGQYAVNIIGGNTNLGDFVNVNQVSIRTSNSAGLTYSKEVEDQSFTDSRVYINTVTGLSGTQFPRGTPGDPVSNLIDAELIIANRNFPKRLSLTGDIVVGNGETVNDFDILGSAFSLASVTLEPGSTSDNLVLTACTVDSSVGGASSRYDDCLISNIVGVEGGCSESKLGGLITATNDVDFKNCYGTFGLIMSGSGLSVNLVNFSGNVTIVNLTDSGSTVNIGAISAVVTIDSSCTAGDVILADVDLVIDNSGPDCDVTIVNQHAVTQAGLTQIPGATSSEVFSQATEGSETFLEAIRLIRAEAAGEVSVSGNTVSFRDAADTKNRIVAVTDSNGQRTFNTVDGT